MLGGGFIEGSVVLLGGTLGPEKYASLASASENKRNKEGFVRHW